MKEPILNLVDLSVVLDDKLILDNISFDLNKNEILTIIGEEGTGKSTLLKAITNQVSKQGKVFYKNSNITNVPTYKLISVGIDFINQNGNVFNNLTVDSHLDMAINNRKVKGPDKMAIYRIFPMLKKIKHSDGGKLSGGERMILSMACLLIFNCELLILDELTAGIATDLILDLKVILNTLKSEGKTIILFEHNVSFSTDVSDSIMILKNEKISTRILKETFLQDDFTYKFIYN